MLAYIRVMADLMSLYHDSDRLKEAVDIGGRLVKAQTAIKGEDDPDRLTYILELARVYKSRKQYPEAGKLQVHVLNKRTQLFGLQDLRTVEAQASLASTYADQPSRLGAAASLKTDVLEMRGHLQGPEHPDTIRAMASLAVTYYNQDKFDEAASLEEKVQLHMFGSNLLDRFIRKRNNAHTIILSQKTKVIE
jgi:tetratricopeptide (TPR) repeat protein